MSEIKTFPFNKLGVEQIRLDKYGSNWPVVYLIENQKELYVGETIRAFARTKQHLENPVRAQLKNIHVVTDDEFNVSATLDTESSLIEYLVADGHYKILNSNKGLRNHNFFDKERYQSKFELVWKTLQEKGIAHNDLLQIRNSDLFKYSPYKTLTDDQFVIAKDLLKEIKKEVSQTYVVHGGPGTGKTILATYLIKQLVEQGITDVALVIAMTPLRKTLQRVFRNITGLKSTMVIGPGDIVKKNYRVLIVDEAHRLRQRKNIPNYGMFDKTNKRFGLDNGGNELDWIQKTAKQVVLFYDERQSVRPSDIAAHRVVTPDTKEYHLKTQMRVKGGDEYLNFVDKLLELDKSVKPNFKDYHFKIFDDVSVMIDAIKKQNDTHTLCRVVAGYAWKWESRNNKNVPDIVIGKTKLFWNSVLTDWVNSPNSINEVGCIHTIQGYDLNYTGVIIGPEIFFNPKTQEIEIDKSKYFDANGHKGVNDPLELKRYIVNIYKTLLTRGILGTYVYICDDNLRERFKEILSRKVPTQQTVQPVENDAVLSPITIEMISIPIVGTAPCGNPLLGEENIEDYAEVPKTKIRNGAKYFAVRAEGDSMNLAGIHDGDLVLCRYGEKGETGDRVVALLNGEYVTIKEYGPRKNGVRLLLPKSTNKNHKPLTPEEGDIVQGVVQEVLSEKEE